MRVLFLVSGIDEVSCRFRVLQYLPHLEGRGIHAKVADLHASLRERWQRLHAARGYDAVCIHRAFLSPTELWRLRRAGVRYVYDFDDAIMFRDSNHRRFRSWQRRLRFARMAAGARQVIAGNSYLAAQARRHSQQVTTIPTALDLAAYPREPAVTRDPVIGWMGTRANLPYLRPLAPMLASLSRRHPGLRLKIVCDGSIEMPGVQVISKPWSLAQEVDDLRSFRTGIMPLPDDPWTRGKCGVKILQYFAASLPVVCSPVGANCDIVDHGRDGYLAFTLAEWEERLAELLADSERCRQLGNAGRTTVERSYSVRATLERLIDVLRDI